MDKNGRSRTQARPKPVGGNRPRRVGLTSQRLFALHGWLGLNFGLLLAIVCLSGAVATLTHEIEWLTEPALRIRPDGPVRWQETYEALQRAYPDHNIGGFARGEPTALDSMAWTAYITAPDESWAQVRLNPYTAEIVRPATRLYLTDYMRQLHYNFHSRAGFYLVGFVAFPLLLSVVSGMLLYKGWWRHLFRVRVRKGRRALWSSVHRLIGVWSLVFGLIIAVTGLWYLVESDLVPRHVAYPSDPKVPAEKLALHGPTPKRLALERYVTAAREAFQELEPNGIYLPGGPDDTVTVQGQAGRLLVRDRANAVFLDPFDAKVIHVRRSNESGPVRWWADSADALHFGYFGGIATKLLWALLGLGLTVLVLSGAYLSFRRAGLVGPKAPGADRAAHTPIHCRRRLPARSWIMLPLLIAITWSCIQGYTQRKMAPAPTTAVGEVAVGPWRAVISREQTVYPGAHTDYFVQFYAGEGRVANFKSAHLWLNRTDESRAAPGELLGHTHSMHAHVPTPANVSGISAVTLDVQSWDNKQFSQMVPHSLAEAPQVILEPGAAKRKYTDPFPYIPAPGTLFAVAWGYFLVASAAAVLWLLTDRTIPQVQHHKAEPGTDHVTTQ